MSDDDFELLFSWLHLSDVHVGHGGAWRHADQELVLDRVKSDILRGTRPAPPPQAVFLTGDVAATGAVRSRDEYRNFQQWFGDVLAGLGLEGADVFAVPGNHDVQRERPEDRGQRRVIAQLRRDHQIDEALERTAARQVLIRRQRRFDKWFKDHGGVARTERKHFAWRHHRTLPHGLGLRVVGLNTSLLCADDTDHGKLALGATQILSTLTPQQDDEVVIALGHHPLDWLADGESAKGWLGQLAHVYLSGHVHAADTTQVFSGSGVDLISVSAGATHEPVEAKDLNPRHGYNVSALGIVRDGTVVLRVWPRVWVDKQKRFIDDRAGTRADRPYAEHVLTRVRSSRRSGLRTGGGSAGDGPASRSSRLSLSDVNDRVVHDVGRRRTAYPSDLSFAELVRRDLYMEPRFTVESDVENVRELCTQLTAGHHALLLGDPGAGKSFATYMTIAALAGGEHAVVTVDLRELRGSRARLTRPALLRKVAARLAGTSARVADDGRPLVMVLDGIDELLSTGYPVEEVVDDLLALSRLGSLLATCRVREYEDWLASRILDMPTVATMAAWDFTSQFVPFVDKLQAAGRLTSGRALVDLVDGSHELRRLVKRPLFARMLTYVVESGRADVTDQASLYRQYLQALADATEAALRRAGHPTEFVYKHWRQAVWWAYQHEHVVDDGIPYLPLVTQLAAQGVDTLLAGRLLEALADVVPVFDELRAKFLHFSFLEYLIGEEAAVRLRTDAGKAAPIGTIDLTVEMRHFMMRITHQTAPADLFGRLLASYRRSSHLPAPQRMTVSNLLVYVLGRLPGSRPDMLQRLLRSEDNAFLRTSLYWALSNVDDRPGVIGYLDVLAGDRDMASLNRGYLLYYYGDLDRTQPPPYRDDPPHLPWASTRRRTMDMMSALDYNGVPPARRLLDAATFINSLEVRREQPTPSEHYVLARVLEAVTPLIEGGQATIRNLLDRAGGSQLAWAFPI